MNYYPTNTLTRFTTRLENAISRSGDGEVGLFEIQYPHSWFNLKRGEVRITYTHNLRGRDKAVQMQSNLRLLSGYYDTPVELVQAVNNSIREYANKSKLISHPDFDFNPITKLIYATISVDTSIHFSPVLCDMLGIEPH